ncbi:MAG: Asp-tRNA(Asn)/Glu-tRNA(Gln) amidotransferase subunit GatC [Anaerolineae bacterium]|nr:Asp-tRNA(Asn)/Glu-tRNA(Gln) amidotransferase subunit GatC [Anaerolineae bacterium]
MNVKLSRAQVIAIAELAKLQLTEDEIERFGGQLSHVLDYAARLEQLDTADIPPTATVLPLRNVFRNDEVRPSLPRDEALANAPDSAEGQFRVGAILE